jgi:hypothetical protein
MRTKPKSRGGYGQPARFGCGEEGRWFCAAHRPEAGRA